MKRKVVKGWIYPCEFKTNVTLDDFNMTVSDSETDFFSGCACKIKSCKPVRITLEARVE